MMTRGGYLNIFFQAPTVTNPSSSTLAWCHVSDYRRPSAPIITSRRTTEHWSHLHETSHHIPFQQLTIQLISDHSIYTEGSVILYLIGTKERKLIYQQFWLLLKSRWSSRQWHWIDIAQRCRKLVRGGLKCRSFRWKLDVLSLDNWLVRTKLRNYCDEKILTRFNWKKWGKINRLEILQVFSKILHNGSSSVKLFLINCHPQKIRACHSQRMRACPEQRSRACYSERIRACHS